MAERDGCAACGKKPVVLKATFLCCNVERYICDACWSKSENDEAWYADISNRIQLRDRALDRKLKPEHRTSRADEGSAVNINHRESCGRCHQSPCACARITHEEARSSLWNIRRKDSFVRQRAETLLNNYIAQQQASEANTVFGEERAWDEGRVAGLNYGLAAVNPYRLPKGPTK